MRFSSVDRGSMFAICYYFKILGFKDAIIRFGIEENWYRFREEALKDIAIRWCERNDITFIMQ